MIEAAIFDWGGVVARSPAAAMPGLDRRLGLGSGALREFFEPGRFFTLEEWVAVSGGAMPEAEFWRAVCRRFPIPPSPELAERAFAAVFLASARPSMLGVLREVQRRCRLVLLSNATPSLRRVVEPLRVFDELFISVETRLRKPDGAAFQAVLAWLGTRPERTVFVDDTDDNVQAARRLGILALRYRRTDVLCRRLRRLELLPRGLTGR